jgi:diguanylate cyclase (GGDEF)-like protein
MTEVSSEPTVTSRLDPLVVHAFLTTAQAVAWITLAAGLAVVIGWQAGLPDLAALYMGAQPIRATTGLAFILSSAALLAALHETPIARRLRLPAALGVLALGLLALMERAGVHDTGLRYWVLVSGGWTFNATMPLVAGVYFVMLGLHGIASCRGRGGWIAGTLALVTLATSMVALAAQGVSAAGAGTESVLSPATPGAAMLLFANAIAWIAARPSMPLCAVAAARGQGGYIARRLLLPAMLLPLAYSWLIQWSRGRLGIDDAFLIALSAFVNGGSVAALVWWVAYLSGYGQYQRSRAAALDDIAHTDALTGIANRRAFDKALQAKLRGLRRHGQGFFLLMLDADRFKAYNDDFGHAAGDEALKAFGQVLGRSLRPTDLAARIGGEEFAVLLDGNDREAAQHAGERIRAALAGHPWPRRGLTASIGVAQARATDNTASLLARADKALYAAKQAGRDRVVLAAE